MRKLFNVLTKNLRVAEGLVYVHQYNAVSWEQELEFICGEQDLLQWQVGMMVHIFTLISLYDAGTRPRHKGIYHGGHYAKPTTT